MVQFDAFWSVFCYNSVKIVKIFIFIKIKGIVLLRTIFKGTLEHTPQNVCLLCNLVRFGLHFLRTFSEANIYINIYVVYFLLIFLHVEGLFCIYGELFFGSPPPEQNFMRALMNIWWYCCALDKGMEAYAPPPFFFIKLHVWSIYLIKFPHLLSIRGACTPEKPFLGDAI